ncbi:DUF6339 family protein [Tessaracoccus oleiagri]|uniref:Uncharacterized protein n=1 Tax=Tessaracoccus oleiagri TaxID=686624 RepID=A0A1G9I0N2_9ACTN|nr:DUF6339 family protein [Tessaracoccus oleiagri]SDL18484.1 hypothetical protein SAMN04488242_0635 [Tessaracoccus oleiagri]
MNSYFAYPRLPDGDTLALHKVIVETASTAPGRLGALAATSHPRAQAVPTGAQIATEAHIEWVRSRVHADLERWGTGSPVPRTETVSFDRALGASLFEHLQIMPADAGHETTWNFLTAVVFPDIAWARFPELHPDRVLGKRHRNTLRRAWYRHSVLGDLQAHAHRPLGEDEMTGLFERPTLAMNPTLIRLLAKMIIESDIEPRTDYARHLTKRATALTGTYMLDGLDAEEIRELLDPNHRTDGGEATPSSSGAMERHLQRRHDANDLVAEFHREMVELCERMSNEAGHRPISLRHMVERAGGLEAARLSVSGPHRSETFIDLRIKGRLDLTVESLVIRSEFRGLFPRSVVDQAEQRLEEARR